MSTLAVWLFVAVAILFVAMAIGVALAGRSTYRRSRHLVRELTDLGVDLEQVMTAVGRSPSGHDR